MLAESSAAGTGQHLLAPSTLSDGFCYEKEVARRRLVDAGYL
jgi:hypothetical protein